MSKRILIIGIDGGTWSILTGALTEGYLPCLKSLVDSGASGILESTIPALTPAAWGVFQTGMNPGATGVFNFAYWDKQQKRMCFLSSKSFKSTLWDIAGQAGKRLGLLNVPMTYPPKPVNGYMVTGILTPSLEADFTYPPELKSELLKNVPEFHILNLENMKEPDREKFELFVRQMTRTVENRARAAEFIINKEPLDLFMVHFQASDLVQHALWGYLDQNHPLYDPDKRRFILDNFYRQLDNCIRSVRQTFVGPNADDCITFIVSDHGFQTHNYRFNLGNWLCSEGYLKLNPRSDRPPLLKKITRKLGVGKLLTRLMSSKSVARMEKSLKLDIAPFHWEQSRAFAMGRSAEGFIYLLEEEPARREKTASEISEKIKQVRHPQTQQNLVHKVHRKEQLYHGAALETLPDLIVEPAPGFSFTGVYRKNQDLFHPVHPDTDIHVGVHHPDGILIAAGKDIQNQNGLRARLWDLAPTILYCLGLPAKSNMEGQIIENMFAEEFKKQHPPLPPSDAPEAVVQNNNITYTAEDKKILEKRLQDLGYM